MVINNLRKPFDKHLPVHVGRFRHVRHVKVTVVVVPNVVLEQHRQPFHLALRRILLAHIPVGHEFLPVRIGQHAKLDGVVQQPHRLRIGLAHHFIDLLHLLLRSHRFGRMQSAVYPHNRLAFARQRMRLFIGEVFRVRQLLRNALIMFQLLDVFRRTDNRHVLLAVLGRRADIYQLHAIRFAGQLLPVSFQLGVVGHVIVVSKIEAEGFHRSRYFRCSLSE